MRIDMNPNVTSYWRQHNMLNGVEDEMPIYKFMPLKYTLAMVRNNLLTINRISSWPDVYENYMLKQECYLQDGTPIDVINQTAGIYGQCWTYLPESDAMWRIYSPSMDTIRIKTTVEKLYDALYQNDHNMADTYIGLVRYERQTDIDRNVQSLSPIDSGVFLKEVVKGAFVKRMEFEHEKEVRIVRMLDSQQTLLSGAFLHFPIPADFIEEFCIDPRADDAMVANLTNQLTSIGIPASMICKSQLYQFNSHQMVFK